MKKKTTKTILGILLISSVTFVSCKKDDPLTAEETNTPTQTDIRDKFLGAYQVKDTGYNGGGPYTGTYTIVISKSGVEGDSLVVNNFAESGGAKIGIVTGNSLYVAREFSYQTSGTGTLSGTKIKFNYTTPEGSRRGTATKQ